MIQLDFQATQLYHSLGLQRYSFHQEEIKRALKPILEEVYQIGYDCGRSDEHNNLQSRETLHANVEVIHVKEEVCEQSSIEKHESTEEANE